MSKTKTVPTDYCGNCEQWLHPDTKGGFRCINDCQSKGFDPKHDAKGNRILLSVDVQM